ncbi:PHO85 cyclin-9 [Monosporozyma servazzii]
MMNDYHTLLEFNRKPVNNDMVQYLVKLTSALIKVPPTSEWASNVPRLTVFIKKLVIHSNVQTATLMATTVYLTKLKNIIPNDVYGIETTIHRIFLGCLILASKILNDTSPMNKHWTKYTDGLLNIYEVNTIERELLEYFQWDIRINTEELINSMRPLLDNHKAEMIKELERNNLFYFNAPLSTSPHKRQLLFNNNMNVKSDEIPSFARSVSPLSIPSISSSSTMSTFSNVESIFEAEEPYNPYNVPLTEYITIDSPTKKHRDDTKDKEMSNWSINLKHSNYLKPDKLMKFKNTLFKKA